MSSESPIPRSRQRSMANLERPTIHAVESIAPFQPLNDEEIERFFNELDFNGNGSVEFNELEKKYPGIKEKVLDSCAVTVNLEYVDLEENTAVIKDGDEVGIIPPVSSG